MTEALEIRKTHKYVGEYSHMDEWETIGEVKVTARAVMEWNPDYVDEEDAIEDPQTITYFVEVESFTPLQSDVEQALRDKYTNWGCAHEYDCCGCRNYMVTDVVKRDAGRYIVIVHSSRNY